MPAKKNRRPSQDVSPASSGKPQAAAFITPMAALVVKELPEGDEWVYELKLDGYRALIIKNESKVEIRSRNDKDLTRMYPNVAAVGRRLNADRAVIDGEIVAVDEEGRPSFQALQHRSSHPKHKILFFAFDVLHLNGRDMTRKPLERRRSELQKVVTESGLLMSVQLPGTVADIVSTVQAMGLEGVVAKRKDSLYEPGERSNDWVKLKLERQQEFVVGGYRPEGQNGIDALLVGYYDAGNLRFAGKVRAGLIPHVRRELVSKLRSLRTDRCPFVDLPNNGSSRWGGGINADEMKEMQWTEPKMVAQIRFVEWTAENRLRHAKFLGLRLDKNPMDVCRER
jgi:bifunctional non-homologous end joining protein LigD